MTDTDNDTATKRLLYPHEIYIDPLTGLKEWTNEPAPKGCSEKYIRADLIRQADTANEEMAAVLQDMFTLCEQGEFEPEIFLAFIRDGKTRNLMQYHRDYFQKLTSKQ